jgi:hypothetical protein
MRPDHRSLLLALSCASLVALGAPGSAHAFAIDVSDSTANSSRTIHAHEDGNLTVEMFKISFTAAAGEKRRIRGQINVSMPGSAADDILLVIAGIQCASGTSHAGGADAAILGNAQNVLRGGNLTLLPRIVYTATASGIQTCGLLVNTGRPRPAVPGADDPSNYFTVDGGSSIEATVALHPGSAQGFRLDPPSRLLESGQAYDAASFLWTAPAGVTSFTMSGDVKVTTCTAVGGSLDGTTGGVNLCAGHVVPTGSQVSTVVQALQLKTSDPTSPCAVTSSPPTGFTTTTVDKDVHHRMIYGGQNVAVSPAADCSRTFRIKVYVKNLASPSLAAFVVHVPSSITAVMPD